MTSNEARGEVIARSLPESAISCQVSEDERIITIPEVHKTTNDARNRTRNEEVPPAEAMRKFPLVKTNNRSFWGFLLTQKFARLLVLLRWAVLAY